MKTSRNRDRKRIPSESISNSCVNEERICPMCKKPSTSAKFCTVCGNKLSENVIPASWDNIKEAADKSRKEKREKLLDYTSKVFLSKSLGKQVNLSGELDGKFEELMLKTCEQRNLHRTSLLQSNIMKDMVEIVNCENLDEVSKLTPEDVTQRQRKVDHQRTPFEIKKPKSKRCSYLKEVEPVTMYYKEGVARDKLLQGLKCAVDQSDEADKKIYYSRLDSNDPERSNANDTLNSWFWGESIEQSENVHNMINTQNQQKINELKDRIKQLDPAHESSFLVEAENVDRKDNTEDSNSGIGIFWSGSSLLLDDDDDDNDDEDEEDENKDNDMHVDAKKVTNDSFHDLENLDVVAKTTGESNALIIQDANNRNDDDGEQGLPLEVAAISKGYRSEFLNNLVNMLCSKDEIDISIEELMNTKKLYSIVSRIYQDSSKQMKATLQFADISFSQDAMFWRNPMVQLKEKIEDITLTLDHARLCNQHCKRIYRLFRQYCRDKRYYFAHQVASKLQEISKVQLHFNELYMNEVNNYQRKLAENPELFHTKQEIITPKMAHINQTAEVELTELSKDLAQLQKTEEDVVLWLK